MLMSCSQKIGQKHSIKIVNRSSEDVAKFKYLGTTLTDHNCMHKKINSRLISWNGCYCLVQNIQRPRYSWEDVIKMDLREISWGAVEWIKLAQDRDCWQALVNVVMTLWVLEPGS
jgi:hypothetical protein